MWKYFLNFVPTKKHPPLWRASCSSYPSEAASYGSLLRVVNLG